MFLKLVTSPSVGLLPPSDTKIVTDIITESTPMLNMSSRSSVGADQHHHHQQVPESDEADDVKTTSFFNSVYGAVPRRRSSNPPSPPTAATDGEIYNATPSLIIQDSVAILGSKRKKNNVIQAGEKNENHIFFF